MRKFILSALVALSFNINSFAQTGDWFWINPKPTGNDLKDVEFLNSNTGYAVGFLGTIVKTTDGGSNWENLKSPTGGGFYSCSFINVNTGFAGGEKGTVYKTIDGGLSWISISIPGVNGNYQPRVSFADASVGLYCASERTYFTTNGGVSWSEITSAVGNEIENVHAKSSNELYVSGKNMLRSSNFGQSWEILYTSQNQYDVIKEIFVKDPDNIIAHISNFNVGNKVIKTTNGGTNWTAINLGLYSSYGGISFDELGNGIVGSIYGKIFRSTNWGISWTMQTYSDTTKTFNSVSCLGNNKFIIVGNAGQIIYSSNAGSNWELQTKSFTNKRIFAVHFFDTNTGFVTGGEGRVFRTFDGGDNWERIYIDDTTRDIQDITFTSASTGYMSNGSVYKTTNGGSNWFTVYDSLNIMHKVAFRDNDLGLSYSETGYFSRTTDGGSTWQILTQPIPWPVNNYKSYYEVAFSPSGIAIATHTQSVSGASGFPVTARSTDGGYIWSGISGGISGEGMFYGSIAFSPDNMGYVSYGYNKRLKSSNGFASFTDLGSSLPYGTSLGLLAFNDSLNGVSYWKGIRRTTDGGETWELSSTITEQLKDRQFIDEDNIIMVGEYGRIVSTNNGGSIITNLTNSNSNIPDQFSLHQNYPNPFNPSTKIKFDLPESSLTSLKVYDITGRLVTTLVNSRLNSGSYSYTFNASGLSSGMYFYKLETEGLSETKKMMLIK